MFCHMELFTDTQISVSEARSRLSKQKSKMLVNIFMFYLPSTRPNSKSRGMDLQFCKKQKKRGGGGLKKRGVKKRHNRRRWPCKFNFSWRSLSSFLIRGMELSHWRIRVCLLFYIRVTESEIHINLHHLLFTGIQLGKRKEYIWSWVPPVGLSISRFQQSYWLGKNDQSSGVEVSKNSTGNIFFPVNS